MKIGRRELTALVSVGAAALAGTYGLMKLGRFVADRLHDRFVGILTSDLYDENLWELYSSTARIGAQVALETNLRADAGKLIERPMGPPNQFPDLEDLKFNVAQLYSMPTEVQQEVSLDVVIGPDAKRPLMLSHPMMMSGMAYGIALSKEVKIALAKGTAQAGTAAHVGAGAFLPEEREAAKYLIYQYNRGDWGKTPEIMKQCDAVEIQLGQGAYGGVGHISTSEILDRQLRKDFNKNKGEDLITNSRHPEVQTPEDLANLVSRLKAVTGGIPVGVKIAAGKYLEMDLYWICSAGADFIVLDGAEAASKGSPPILQDDFGVPTVFAVDRAAKWMTRHGYKDHISLIASGRIRKPGDCLKACALGADACQIASIALYAVSHKQILKALPFEPPTAITWYGERFAKDFDIETGAKSLKNFLESCKLEMAEGIRALGKTALSQVDREDLMCAGELLAKGLSLPMIYEPYDPITAEPPPKVRKLRL